MRPNSEGLVVARLPSKPWQTVHGKVVPWVPQGGAQPSCATLVSLPPPPPGCSHLHPPPLQAGSPGRGGEGRTDLQLPIYPLTPLLSQLTLSHVPLSSPCPHPKALFWPGLWSLLFSCSHPSQHRLVHLSERPFPCPQCGKCCSHGATCPCPCTPTQVTVPMALASMAVASLRAPFCFDNRPHPVGRTGMNRAEREGG